MTTTDITQELKTIYDKVFILNQRAQGRQRMINLIYKLSEMTTQKLPENRNKALTWFHRMDNNNKQQIIVAYNHLIQGDTKRLPSTLTGKEIETLYNAVFGITQNKIKHSL